MKFSLKNNSIKNKKLFKIVGISLAVIAAVGLMSSIMINTFMNVHDCKVSKTIYYDSSGHYYKCTENRYCNKKFQLKSHNLQWVIDKEETFEENGYKHRECDCGYKVNVGTVIDNFKYNPYLSLDNRVHFMGIGDFFEDGNHNTSIKESLSITENGFSRNISMTARYCMMTKSETDGSLVKGNSFSDTLYSVKNDFSFFDANGYKYTIQLCTRGKNQIEHSLDILIGDEMRYRLISDEITELCNDYIQNSVLDVDFGLYHVGTQDYICAFRFKTENCEITYLSDNSGTIKNETKFFSCQNASSTTGTEYSFDSLLGWLCNYGIYNNSSINSIIDIGSNMYSGGARFGSCVSDVSCDSVWFANRVKYIEWQNS